MLKSGPEEGSGLRPRPTEGLPRVGGLLIEKFAPPTVEAGERFTYSILLSNDGATPVQGLVLVESLNSMITIDACDPAPMSSEHHTSRWAIEPIWPGDSRRVSITCTARKKLWFGSHTSVAYSLC